MAMRNDAAEVLQDRPGVWSCEGYREDFALKIMKIFFEMANSLFKYLPG